MVSLHYFGVVFLFRNTLVGAIVLLCHDRDEMQTVGLHLQTRALLNAMFPGVDGVIRAYWTGQIEGNT